MCGGTRREVYLKFVLEEIFFVGEFSVEAKELLLFFGHGLGDLSAGNSTFFKGGGLVYTNVHFVLLVRIHSWWLNYVEKIVLFWTSVRFLGCLRCTWGSGVVQFLAK